MARVDKIGLAPGASTSRLRFESNLEEALDGADFVQENVPEREGLKIKIRKEIGGHVANRLQLALYREVAYLIDQDVVGTTGIALTSR